MLVDALSSRTISTYPLSIGTSLAMESIASGNLPAYDDQRIAPERVDLSMYDRVYINLSTLHRNIIGSVGAEVSLGLKPLDLAQVLSQEIEIIREIIHTHSKSSLKLVFYVCGNEGLIKTYPHAQFRTNSTAKQVAAHELLQKTLSEFMKRYMSMHTQDLHHPCDIIYQKGTLHIEHRKRVLLMTHQAIDLLIHQHMDLTHLLESHTGVIKGIAEFHTKLHDGKGLTRIPFIPAMLVVFGDSQTFTPWKKPIREEVIELAQANSWTYKTTPTRMRINLNTLKDRLARDLIVGML